MEEERAGGPADPEAALATLRAAVAGLGSEGGRAQRELERRVDRLESAVREGDGDKARDRLEDLQAEVQDLEEDGRLPAGPGQAVLDAAEGLRSTFGTLDGAGDRDRDDD